MTSPVTEARRIEPTADRARRSGLRLHWWREVLYVVGFYVIYSAVRNQFGSAGDFAVSADRALRNALFVIDIERSVGLFFEEGLQRFFLRWEWFIWFWNVFYGSLHFVVTGAVMITLYVKRPARYWRYRTILMFMTSFALVGFALFPLMPPRLLNRGGEWGADEQQFTFVDTLVEIGGLWSFDSGTMQSISNQWAAMPSLHVGWALWCALAIWPLARTRTRRGLVLAYPVATSFSVVVTANHYWIDGVGGLVVLAAGWYLGTRAAGWYSRKVALKHLARAEAVAAERAATA